MSSDIVIRIRELSKCYEIYTNPRDRLFQILARGRKQYFREFWALKGISLDVHKGETVAILGKNGSGKSTLLQLICGTLNPTHGEIETKGRIAALLELGAGFNPEFTGRENVYLNGRLLGLSKEEIDARFDEIVRFADIGDFIEQPVKTYSSGMYVRLAFAVQACVDPEILIVDEALSVGDIGFQYKCFKRIEALKRKGVTILMVTHSTGTILEYADRCVLLADGNVVIDTQDVLSAVLAYEKGMLRSQDEVAVARDDPSTSSSAAYGYDDLLQIRNSEINVSIGEKRFGSARAIVRGVTIVSFDGREFTENALLKSNSDVVFQFVIASSDVIDDVVLGVSISTPRGTEVWGGSNLAASTPIMLRPGVQKLEISTKLPIVAGDYLFHAGLACFRGEIREELDQRRPVSKLAFWAPREQTGLVYAPITVRMADI